MTIKVAAPLDEIMARGLKGPRQATGVIWRGQTYDWGWLTDAANRISDTLFSLDIGADLPVGFIPRQRPEAVAAFFGLVAARRSLTMIYSYQSAEAMAADVRNLRLRSVVAHEEDWQEALIGAAREAGTVGISLARDGTVSVLPGTGEGGPKDHRLAPAEPSIELLTSGTTGPPKRHPIPFEHFRRSMLDTDYKIVGSETDGRPLLVTVPLANISGIYSVVVAGATRQAIMLEDKFTLPVWLEYQRRFRPSTIGGPPALVKMILDANVPPEDLAGARMMSIGMGPVDPVLRRQFEAKYGIPILPCYGATEFAGAAAAMTFDDHVRYGDAKFGSVGRPVRGVTLRIREEESGTVLEPGDDRTGLLEVLHEAIGPDWIKTNDLGRIDADGFLFLDGRADGVIIRGGFKIHPSAIEAALLQHGAVAACSVVGLPDERLGHVPVAAVEPHPGRPAPTAEELEAWLRQKLPSTNIPVDYRIVAELPRTPSLKIRMDAVRALFEG